MLKNPMEMIGGCSQVRTGSKSFSNKLLPNKFIGARQVWERKTVKSGNRVWGFEGDKRSAGMESCSGDNSNEQAPRVKSPGEGRKKGSASKKSPLQKSDRRSKSVTS